MCVCVFRNVKHYIFSDISKAPFHPTPSDLCVEYISHLAETIHLLRSAPSRQRPEAKELNYGRGGGLSSWQGIDIFLPAGEEG